MPEQGLAVQQAGMGGECVTAREDWMMIYDTIIEKGYI